MTVLENIRLVALREVQVRIRSKAFLISTGIIMLVMVAGFGGAGLAEEYVGEFETAYDVGVVGQEAGATADALRETADRFGMEFNVVTYDSLGDAESRLADGGIDAVLVDRTELLFHGDTYDDVAVVSTEAVRQLELPARLDELGLSVEDLQPILQPSPLETTTLEPGDDVETASVVVAFGAMVLLFVAIVTYGQWVLNGVVEEKSSRVVEVLLSTIRPYQLLAGKVAGILALALGQLTILLALGLFMSVVSPDREIPAVAAWGVAAAAIWFVLGLIFYGFAYGVAGALISRQEEANHVTLPLMIMLGAGYFLTNIFVLNEPGGTGAMVTSLIPFTAPIAMPVRVAFGEAAPWEFLLAVGIMLVTILGAIVVGGRIYAGAILRIGPRVALREAWRFSR